MRDKRGRGEAGNGPQTGDAGLRETVGATIEASALDAKIDEECRKSVPLSTRSVRNIYVKMTSRCVLLKPADDSINNWRMRHHKTISCFSCRE